MAAGDIIVVNENSFGKKANVYDGVDDYMLIDNHAIARVGANDTVGTYSVWIYIDDVSNTATILSAGDNSSTNELLQLFITSSKLILKIKHGGVSQFVIQEDGTDIPSREWTHIAVVQDGTEPVMYMNGKIIATTATTSTDLTFWYDELTLVDKFAVGVLESNNTHTLDFKGAIGQVKYWDVALTAEEVLQDKKGEDVQTGNLELNITMEDDGTTDSGAGADNGTFVGNAHYGGEVSTYSQAMERNVTGHAAEDMNSFPVADRILTIIKRGD